jgi:hypothetical protein
VKTSISTVLCHARLKSKEQTEMWKLYVTNQELCIRDDVTNSKDSLHIVVSGFIGMFCFSYVSTLTLILLM